MKLLARILLILLAGFFLSELLPWWTLVILAFIIGFVINGNSFSVFISGFLGGGLLWLGYAWYLDFTTNSIMSEKIVDLFPVDDKFFLIIISGITGALISGLGAVTGNSLRLIFTKKKADNYYN